MIGLILAGLVAIVAILGAARPVRVLILGVLGLSAVGLLVVWLDYGTIEPCDILTVQVADQIVEVTETKLAAERHGRPATEAEQFADSVILGLLTSYAANTVGPRSPANVSIS